MCVHRRFDAPSHARRLQGEAHLCGPAAARDAPRPPQLLLRPLPPELGALWSRNSPPTYAHLVRAPRAPLDATRIAARSLGRLRDGVWRTSARVVRRRRGWPGVFAHKTSGYVVTNPPGDALNLSDRVFVILRPNERIAAPHTVGRRAGGGGRAARSRGRRHGGGRDSSGGGGRPPPRRPRRSGGGARAKAGRSGARRRAPFSSSWESRRTPCARAVRHRRLRGRVERLKREQLAVRARRATRPPGSARVVAHAPPQLALGAGVDAAGGVDAGGVRRGRKLGLRLLRRRREGLARGLEARGRLEAKHPPYVRRCEATVIVRKLPRRLSRCRPGACRPPRSILRCRRGQAAEELGEFLRPELVVDLEQLREGRGVAAVATAACSACSAAASSSS